MTTVRSTHRWRGVVAVPLVAGAAGLLLQRPSLLFLAAVGVVFATYPRVTSAPTTDLDIERRLDHTTPGHGDPVEVTVEVTNAGDTLVADLRLVDGVPPMLEVSDGTPYHAAALRPGASSLFSYEVTAKRGSHQFEPATAMVRDASGATEVETTVATETAIECRTDLPEVPLRRQTRQYAGHLVTDDGGSGVEFHGTREYRFGDPVSRVDWRRFARSRELTTVEYREERAASVVLCLDAREPAYRAECSDEPHAVSYGRAAVEQLHAELRETPNRVGIAALGRELCWLAPGVGTEHRVRADRLLSTHPTLSTYPPRAGDADDGEGQLAELGKRLGTDTQVVFVSPLVDEFAADAALELEAAGHAVTVVSPDVTADDTAGGQLTGVERDYRLAALRESGIPAVDWSPTDPLGSELVDARERWSA